MLYDSQSHSRKRYSKSSECNYLILSIKGVLQILNSKCLKPVKDRNHAMRLNCQLQLANIIQGALNMHIESFAIHLSHQRVN